MNVKLQAAGPDHPTLYRYREKQYYNRLWICIIASQPCSSTQRRCAPFRYHVKAGTVGFTGQTNEIVACIAHSPGCLISIASHDMTSAMTESGGVSAHLYLWKNHLLLKIHFGSMVLISQPNRPRQCEAMKILKWSQSFSCDTIWPAFSWKVAPIVSITCRSDCATNERLFSSEQCWAELAIRCGLICCS